MKLTMHSCAFFWRGRRRPSLLLLLLLVLLTSCGFGPRGRHISLQGPAISQQSGHDSRAAADICPLALQKMLTCQTPHSLRVAYGMENLIERGMTGKGQTVVDIVSFGSPTLQRDMDVFDRQFGLPPIKLRMLSPLGAAKFNPSNSDMNSWATETTLDVELIHAMAPGAGIVVLTSPVDETEGVIGLPQFLQLEEYAVNHHLGQIFSQSYVASETTLANPAGRKLAQTYTDFYQKITTREGWTVLTGSGDHGATDFSDLAATKFSASPIVNFPADVPWVTAVGGTTLDTTTSPLAEIAWSGSGGGYSTFFHEPAYQQSLPQNLQRSLKGMRGIPDIAANADPLSAMAVYIGGQWQQIGGTSAATPTWAGMIAVANQMAGHPLGFLNPALYALASSARAARDFRDITRGDNSFQASNIRVRGFSATPGWDPVTGWGTPIGENLLPDLIAASHRA